VVFRIFVDFEEAKTIVIIVVFSLLSVDTKNMTEPQNQEKPLKR
jgi:hypothetical protein